MTAYIARLNDRLTNWLMSSRLTNWFKCPNCPERFIRASNRDTHMMMAHTMPLARALEPGFIRIGQAWAGQASIADVARNLGWTDERRAVEEAEKLLRERQS